MFVLPRGSSLVVLIAGCAVAGGPSASPTDAPPGAVIDASPSDDDAPPPGDAGVPDAAVPDAPVSTACATALAGLATGFEAGLAGWTHVVLDGAVAAGWPLDEWQHGTATSGPGSCHGGTKCWATRLDTNYTSCSRAALVSPAIDLSACAGRNIDLAFWSWHSFWSGNVSGKAGTWSDGGVVEVSADGSTWRAVTPSPGYPGTLAINGNIDNFACVKPTGFTLDKKPGMVGVGGGWRQVTVPLAPEVVTSTFRVRFGYSSGVSLPTNNAETNRTQTRPGWYIDDVSFAER